MGCRYRRFLLGPNRKLPVIGAGFPQLPQPLNLFPRVNGRIRSLISAFSLNLGYADVTYGVNLIDTNGTLIDNILEVQARTGYGGFNSATAVSTHYLNTSTRGLVNLGNDYTIGYASNSLMSYQLPTKVDLRLQVYLHTEAVMRGEYINTARFEADFAHTAYFDWELDVSAAADITFEELLPVAAVPIPAGLWLLLCPVALLLRQRRK